MSLPSKYKDAKVVYDDPICTAILGTAINGHVKIFSKKNVNLISELEDDEVSHMFFVSSFAATCAFESLGMQGTNIIVNNSEEFFCIDVIPRKENDGLNFQWDLKQGDPSELQSVKDRIADEIHKIQTAPKEVVSSSSVVKTQDIDSSSTTTGLDVNNPKLPEELADEKPKEVDGEDNEENYLLKSLRRIP